SQVRIEHCQAPLFLRWVSKESEQPIANAMGFFTSVIWVFLCCLIPFRFIAIPLLVAYFVDNKRLTKANDHG
ncbi:hypothetical protein CXF83_00085, partial [Shewanella sp. Choline-02u-19]